MSKHSRHPFTVGDSGLNHKGEPHEVQILDADETTIAKVWHCDRTKREEDIPNAHLFAAAPDLRAVCEDVVDFSRLYLNLPIELIGRWQHLADMAHAAISKAKGGAR